MALPVNPFPDPVVLIAEIGINHNGNRQTAQRLIEEAARAGASAVKFQAFSARHFISPLAPGLSHTEGNVFAQMEALEVREDWWGDLKRCAHDLGLLFGASVFDEHALQPLLPLGLDFVKIASGELTDLPLMGALVPLSSRWIVSTGMATLEEIEWALEHMLALGLPRPVLLECTSAYPAEPSTVFLHNIDYLRETFGCPAGFSDHSRGIALALAAVARGAVVVEKHFTLDRNQPGPDHPLSSDPAELAALATGIREISAALQTNQKAWGGPWGMEGRTLGRKGIVAARDLPANHLIGPGDVHLRRPATGIGAPDLDLVQGARTLQAIPQHTPLTWEMLGGISRKS